MMVGPPQSQQMEAQCGTSERLEEPLTSTGSRRGRTARAEWIVRDFATIRPGERETVSRTRTNNWKTRQKEVRRERNHGTWARLTKTHLGKK